MSRLWGASPALYSLTSVVASYAARLEPLICHRIPPVLPLAEITGECPFVVFFDCANGVFVSRPLVSESAAIGEPAAEE